MTEQKNESTAMAVRIDGERIILIFNEDTIPVGCSGWPRRFSDKGGKWRFCQNVHVDD